MVKREIRNVALKYSRYFSVIAIVGPRQSGKTTFVKNTFNDYDYKNLEEPDTFLFAEDDPREFLNYKGKGLIIDEAQKSPKLFSYIQSIVDDNSKAKFILTGSQNFLPFEKITQSLAGKIGLLKLLPFSMKELRISHKTDLNELIFNGFYLPIHDKKIHPNIWLSILETSFIIIFLRPYHKNFNKRIIKSPKLYFIDTGLASSLLGIKNSEQLNEHFLRGALFENLIISELLKHYYNKALSAPIYYWRDKLGREIDFIIENEKNIFALEIKSAGTPNIAFMKNLQYWNSLSGNPSDNSFVIYGGKRLLTNRGIKFFPWFRINDLLK